MKSTLVSVLLVFGLAVSAQAEEALSVTPEETWKMVQEHGEIDNSDSHNLKVEYIYRALVEDKLVQPLAKKDISIPNMKHKLALWITRQLPADHPLPNQH